MTSRIDSSIARLVLRTTAMLFFFPTAICYFNTPPLYAWQDRQQPTKPQADSSATSSPDTETESEKPDEFPLTELPPLKRMVLYNSGVGQLQHGGKIDGNARLEIRFGSQDVDNVLKSLVFSDSGGGLARQCLLNGFQGNSDKSQVNHAKKTVNRFFVACGYSA